MQILPMLRDNKTRLETARQAAYATLETISDTAERSGQARLTPEQERAFASAQAEVESIDVHLDEITERIAELEVHAARAALAEKGAASRRPIGRDSGTSVVRGAALDLLERSTGRGVSDATIAACVRAVEADPTDKVAEVARATGDPDYLSAFSKVIRDPEHGTLTWTENERAAFARVTDLTRAMSVGTNNAGGYAVPFTLDPAFTVTGAGAINPMRALASIRQTASSNWHGVTAGQISAAWTGESTVVADSSPTLAQPTLTLATGRAFIPASFEAFDDIPDLAAEIAMLLADGKNNLEATAFATGSGSAQPKGIVTAVNAVTASPRRPHDWWLLRPARHLRAAERAPRPTLGQRQMAHEPHGN